MENQSQDFFNINPDVPEKESLEDRFFRERQEWKNKVKEMSLSLKKVFDLTNLLAEIYTERQKASEYYHYLLSLLVGLNKKYRNKYDERWAHYTLNSKVRYPNESTKSNRILVDLEDLVEKRELLNVHAKSMESTVKTIDNMIYGIQARIKIEDINRGK
jgi:hypothetical protein